MPKAAQPFARLIRVSTTRIDGGNLFGSTAKDKWESFANPDRQNRVAIGNYSMLIAHSDGWVLVNAGPGDKAPLDLDVAPMRSRSSLLRELRELGLLPKDIGAVIYTHLHDEHVGGGTHMTSSGRVLPTFPNARYVVQKAAIEEAATPNERSSRYYRPDDYLPLEESGQLDVVDGCAEVMKGIRVEPAPGPTAGHQIVVAENEKATYAFLGTLVPTTMHLLSDVVAASDWNPESTSTSKRDFQRHSRIGSWLVGPVGVDEWVPALNLDHLAERNSPAGHNPRATTSFAAHIEMPEAIAV
ncbi:MAG: Glyoxylase, beta-lactamase superfamily II [Chloroflexi bacterium]|jgi:glyoxylase-like metal-dependent hydrolase (beta-lactamase superfamily II)|nr:MAG: Glyoxylase, beta-lactamase superfamily II [Chloroflexota bacterium]